MFELTCSESLKALVRQFSSIAIELNVPRDDFSSLAMAIELTFVTFGQLLSPWDTVLKKPVQSSLIFVRLEWERSWNGRFTSGYIVGSLYLAWKYYSLEDILNNHKTATDRNYFKDMNFMLKFWLLLSNLICINRTGLVVFLTNCFHNEWYYEVLFRSNACDVFTEITATRHGHCFLTACYIFKPRLQNVIDHGSSSIVWKLGIIGVIFIRNNYLFASSAFL